MKTVILAGGFGTRLREESEFKPKPLVEIGGHPILWHIMQTYLSHGFKEFEVLAGYKQEMIKRYFSEYLTITSDVTFNLGNGLVEHLNPNMTPNWKVTVINTGLNTPTGGRIFANRDRLKGSTFFCTYGDGLSDIDIQGLLEFHESHGKIATVTVVRPNSRFGVMRKDKSGLVTEFLEKPKLDGNSSAGYFVFEPEILDYLTAESTLETEPLANLALAGQLMAFTHDGFWEPMDTYREVIMLNSLWATGNAPWKADAAKRTSDNVGR